MKRVRVIGTMAVAVAWVLLFFSASASAQQQVIFLVRHAERADAPAGQPPAAGMMANDPPLSDAGRQRATRLATILASAEIKHIFTTEYQRTRQTADPIAEKLNLKPVASVAREPNPLIEQLLKATGNVLVVGHSNTVPDLLKGLGVTQTIAIPDSEYDNLFVVVRQGTREPTLIRLRY